ncbi:MULTISPECIES: DegT/DnrJ/EryC1/StrS family aminotransferase [Rhodanobacter]|jgi:dTDP-4-amino-4,6-dideoxygalactose transaminase|uniref:DegT/DnrJ/EryC1/StrS family aminotransferase n=1 Tax=Rhodanobacter TaxID=75309 RepID=UPI0004212BD6|nr:MULTISPECIES: DegT/DnrJ/EryC1/StrS family aminotransferase [Rhodanobacter]KZC19492.1 erythromycin biosynthesis sensory transduction protein eryC1 [Rhodanobacter denitrificans]UJJ51657.1 DegT/DnrJ/EryC1/StrS family aminotransferase [Rhodanobacter denitrificans]UJM94401.1 DegT/DnrJ/EryC1/StrS family aminotransferase [Rhodanobacter denitrificans]UJM97931.1 DegT/DnrJ/EryC1/StrS family aminotransferase [Rhodanobacter denitrificans]UJN22655.1 DegT/DnrJ/EryC1/StrS family aminotransferase [Rhodanob
MTNIPVNALDRHIAPLREQLTHASSNVISSGYFVLGPNVSAFEKEFATYCGVSDCVGVANGTEALELGLRSIGITQGKRVALVANAAMYGTTAVLACGAEPVFVDIDPAAHTLDPRSLEAVLAAGRLDAVIVTHLYGRLADMEAIMALADKHGFAVFEDCAQAHGARDVSGRRVGSFGKAASFSFYPTKNLGAIGDGGAIVTNDPQIADTLRKLRQYGWTAKYRNELPGGRNSRLDELQAAFLRTMLPLLDGWNARRREIANRYSREIRNERIQVPPTSSEEYVAHLYVVQASDRTGLQQHLATAGVGSDVHYPTGDHRQPLFRDRFVSTTLPSTEAACQSVLTLPCFPELTDDEATRVIRACNNF